MRPAEYLMDFGGALAPSPTHGILNNGENAVRRTEGGIVPIAEADVIPWQTTD